MERIKEQLKFGIIQSQGILAGVPSLIIAK
jgi:hypothetical protein